MKALTANRLIDGEVVFWKGGKWVERFADADLFEDDAAGEAAEAHAKSQPTVVIDPYLIELMDADGIWAPLSYRERIRALGPTNHLAHGKQAEGGEVVEALQHAAGAARSSGRVNLIKRK
ncbi:DUF2849 domain-containing protein [Phenylobacterium sp.]|uniref:DUF2849 domain-containing protein n=1 Tax=Phenylobacterium sp. TaxID=1871053 RepID=UPI0008C10450|nr:DUF2849 domain-containing protein [Phenylobacterium sp.]MBA4793814.1 DUF2849 domain-containing protein [Phenylobacterium sp.]MBC7168889.1 DUF2849 domain-containing protein [Phenylobacterium sp.]OHB41130.1 MAG: hypothetical protein A2882_15070 [Phenylobacterium sp. RIFCSPHIGHO2_01_FULL_70_10]